MGKLVWGKDAERRHFGDSHWKEPLKWNVHAEEEGVRRRVFCASMADVFEQRKDLDAARARLWTLIGKTPWLDWLLLTKRPGPALRMVPWTDEWPENVWFGTTVEDQHWATKRLPHLLRARARVRFVSCEPLLGALDLTAYLGSGFEAVNWVIAGGESGGLSRPTDPQWIRSLRDQCQSSAVPFHFKQWGNWRPVARGAQPKRSLPVMGGGFVERVGKKIAGRKLDGRTWDYFPG
jgi:protein gp37